MATWYMDFVQGSTTRSDRHAGIFGYKAPPAVWDFDIFLEHVIPDDRSLAKEKYTNGLKNGLLDFETRIKWPDESIHWIHIKGATSYNLKGNPISMSGVVMDVTEAKHLVEKERQLAMEQAAREMAERQGKILHDLFMDAPALICTLKGHEHIFDLINPLYQKLFIGRELQGRPLLEALPELEGQSIKEMLESVYQTGETQTGNEVPVQLDRLNTGKLETIYFNFTYQAMRDNEGNINGILVFAFEVTDQIKARQLIESNEESLRMALEAGKMGTWDMDLLHDTSTRSPQHDQIFGYEHPLPEWGYRHFLQHILPEDRDMVEEQFDKAKASGELYVETRVLRTEKKRTVDSHQRTGIL